MRQSSGKEVTKKKALTPRDSVLYPTQDTPRDSASRPTQDTTWELEPLYRESYQAWKENPCPETADALLKAVRPILNSAIRQFQGTTSPLGRAQAKILALEALERYDPTASPLRPFLYAHLRRLYRLSGLQTMPLRLPERLALQRRQLEEVERELTDELNRAPADQEIADRMGISLRRLQQIRRPPVPLMTSQLADNVKLETPGDERTAWLEFVYSDCDPQDQFILEHTLGLHGRPILSMTEIARKLKISPPAVSQRLAKLREKLSLRDDFGFL